MFGTFAGAVIGSVTSLATGQLFRQRPPDISATLTAPGAGRTFNVRQPTPPHQVVIGRIKVSGPVMFMHSAQDDEGRDDGYFYIQIALAGHRCKQIDDVFIHDELATETKFDSLVTIGRNRGTSAQVEDALFLADLGAVFEDHWLRGRCNIAVRLKGRASAFPNGLPNLSAIVWGADQMYDPRDGSTGWSNNPAIVIAWYMTWSGGFKIAWAKLDEDALVAAANVCDERVRVAAITATVAADQGQGSPSVLTGALVFTGAGRALDVGDGVRLSSSGTLPAPLAAATTYYVIPFTGGAFKLASSGANALAGAAIPVTNDGTGTHTLTYWDEARYKVNGMFTLDAEKFDIREQMLTAMAGYCVEIGGKWFIHAGAPAVVTKTLTADDLRGDFSVIPKRSMPDRFNGVRAVFVNADNAWQPGDAPPLAPTTALLAEDNDAVLYQDIRLPFTTSARTAQRLMKIYRGRNRQQSTVAFPAKLTAMSLAPLDGVYLTYERFGFSAEQHVVMGWALAEDGGIDLELQQDDAAIYAWTSAEEQTVSITQDASLPDPSTISAPAAVTVTTIVTPTYAALVGAWSEVMSIWLDGYDVEYRPAGGGSWTSYGRVGAEDASRIAQVERTAATDFRVRSVTKNGSTSDFTEGLAPAKPTGHVATPGASRIDLTWVNGAGAAQVQIFVNTVNTFSSSTLLTTLAGTSYSHTALGSPGSGELRYYWLRSVASGGNISDETTSVNATSL